MYLVGLSSQSVLLVTLKYGFDHARNTCHSWNPDTPSKHIEVDMSCLPFDAQGEPLGADLVYFNNRKCVNRSIHLSRKLAPHTSVDYQKLAVALTCVPREFFALTLLLSVFSEDCTVEDLRNLTLRIMRKGGR